MMRSLFSAVSGLKTHQTRMDVIGNNIANVNTEAFKSSTVTFSEILYQTTSGAKSGGAGNSLGGINAKQIGLGVSLGTTSVNITGAGAAETTGNPFDLKITDSQTTNFFVVSDGITNKFTRAGSFYVDGNGYMCMSSTGYKLMGWQVDEATGEIRRDTVTPLHVMAPQNQTAMAEATTQASISGILDKNDIDVNGDGYITSFAFYDKMGYSYTAKLKIKQAMDGEGDEGEGTPLKGQYTVELEDIQDSNGKSLIYPEEGEEEAEVELPALFSAVPPEEGEEGEGDADPGESVSQMVLQFDTSKGTMINIGASAIEVPEAGEGEEAEPVVGASGIMLNLSALGGQFEDIEIDFSQSLNLNNSGNSTFRAMKGSYTGADAGKKVGVLTGIQVDSDGSIYGSYDNGNTALLCQIAAAQFANASGLEKVGENCYGTTLNSGEFDGVGTNISSDGSTISSGELEMSNVDLSGEFTGMIVTQRGFQANSRVITVSDTMLEELINLKR